MAENSGYNLSESGESVFVTPALNQTPSSISTATPSSAAASALAPSSSTPADKSRRRLGVRKAWRNISAGRASRTQETPDRLQEALNAVHALSSEDQCVRDIRSDASWWTIIKWTDHYRDDLEGEIDKLRLRIRDFRQYLDLRQPSQPIANLGSPGEDHYTSKISPQNLERLHKALQKLNSSATTRHVFSVRIDESEKSNRQAIQDFPGVEGRLRDGSRMLFLQKHEKDAESTFVAIEMSPTEGENALAPELLEVKTLTSAAAIAPPSAGSSPKERQYTSCGTISAPGDAMIRHHVFVEVKPWQAKLSFSEYLDDQTFRDMLKPVVLLEVFRTILIAYLDFELVREVCRHPRLEDFKTFRWPTYEADAGDESAQPDPKDAWRSPYWSCGFGTPQPRGIPGASRTEKEPNEAVVNLALVLFQLGSRSKKILAPQPNGISKPWRDLKLDAISRLEDVIDHCGLPMANVVEACLLADAQSDRKTVCGCLGSLENLKTEFQTYDVH